MDQLHGVWSYLSAHLLHGLSAGQAEDGDLLNQLGALSLSRENGPESHEFSKNAADGPNVDFFSVVRASEDELWGSVVP